MFSMKKLILGVASAALTLGSITVTMAKMKKMSPAEQAKMIKDDFMTIEAFRIMYREISGGGMIALRTLLSRPA